MVFVCHLLYNSLSDIALYLYLFNLIHLQIFSSSSSSAGARRALCVCNRSCVCKISVDSSYYNLTTEKYQFASPFLSRIIRHVYNVRLISYFLKKYEITVSLAYQLMQSHSSVVLTMHTFPKVHIVSGYRAGCFAVT